MSEVVAAGFFLGLTLGWVLGIMSLMWFIRFLLQLIDEKQPDGTQEAGR